MLFLSLLLFYIEYETYIVNFVWCPWGKCSEFWVWMPSQLVTVPPQDHLLYTSCPNFFHQNKISPYVVQKILWVVKQFVLNCRLKIAGCSKIHRSWLKTVNGQSLAQKIPKAFWPPDSRTAICKLSWVLAKNSYNWVWFLSQHSTEPYPSV